MHDVPADDYLWPTCGACHRDLWEAELDRHACRICEDRTRERLAELPGLFARLDTAAAMMRGARRPTNGTSGGRTAPIPPRLEVLNLVAAGGAATRLQAIEDAWRLALGRRIDPATDGVRIFASWRSNPARAVPGHVAFIKVNLERACERYDEVGQDIEDIRRLHAEMAAALTGEQRPGRVKIGACPVMFDDGTRCGVPLTVTTANHRVRCAGCGTRWDDLAAWRELRRAQEAIDVQPERSAA